MIVGEWISFKLDIEQLQREAKTKIRKINSKPEKIRIKCFEKEKSHKQGECSSTVSFDKNFLALFKLRKILQNQRLKVVIMNSSI